MRSRVAWSLYLPSLILLVGTQMRADEPAAPLPSPLKAGTFSLAIESGGFKRTVQVHIPTDYKPTVKPPLVLLLHGAGGNGLQAMQNYGWDAKSDQAGFLVVAPDGLPALPRRSPNFLSNPPLWNSGQLKSGSPRTTVDDVAFIRQLLDELTVQAPYDVRRVYIAGHSNGGGMAFRLATELSDRFAAIGTVAGMMAMEKPMPKRPLPTLYILGTKDLLMPIEGGEVKLPWGTRQKPPVAEPLAKWATALGCEKEPTTISKIDGVEKLEYRSLADGPTLTVLYLEGHGHQWPGGKGKMPARLVGPNHTTLNATEAIWEFFETVEEQHRLLDAK